MAPILSNQWVKTGGTMWNKGQPSGTNKSDKGTGIPTDKFVDNMDRDKELTDEYTDRDQDVADGIQQNNPNRNTEKTDATNAGGYKQ
jgi:hypothetical protein